MKKKGILNSQLAAYIAALGHKDMFLIGDAGMPIPKGIPMVDLAVIGGVPTFKQVLDAVLEETEVEFYYLAEEILENNPILNQYISEKLNGLKFERMPHTQFKEMTKQVKFAVRTGEFTPYPNIILTAGVAF
ncbi:D-ribose pyranase [Cellulosilyticum sp. I15G10I2]|uniref:D-ribose pyranase n=1 Tax=Cellulosilyticum sp. I15G10I2 TaxID=1892843 RepID=UPI00085CBDDB|nr:D-ribose pyranase [Cellulosilyticum sp. I15G10I2]